MSTWAIVPIKQAVTGKSRLAGCVGDLQRQRLICHMLDTVLNALDQSPAIDQVLLVTDQRHPPESSRPHHHTIADNGEGLNAALAKGLAYVVAEGAQTVMMIHADLPLITGEEISAMIALGVSRGVAIAPDRKREGTNALCFATALNMPPLFGRNSFTRHRSAALALGSSPAVVESPGLGFDVDEPEDLRAWQEKGPSGGTSSSRHEGSSNEGVYTHVQRA